MNTGEKNIPIGILIVMFGLLISILLAFKACTRGPSYPGEWIHGEGPPFYKIARTLAVNRVSGCGDFWYKLERGRDKGEAIVFCRISEAKSWKMLTVFYETERIVDGVQYSGEPPQFQR
ncbi:hypothetical protein [Stenotrophomonas sp. SKA14]|uniref:hypothetical protein n=1 Tax=Stenotrophomonas sp. SKA14 TaxID=391601 RepID=UPI000586A3B0|nr:hypothetical protein [Stenotrophomonas sp. SKA14]